MIEVRRNTYMDELTGIRTPGEFDATQKEVCSAIAGYCGIFESKGSPDA